MNEPPNPGDRERPRFGPDRAIPFVSALLGIATLLSLLGVNQLALRLLPMREPVRDEIAANMPRQQAWLLAGGLLFIGLGALTLKTRFFARLEGKPKRAAFATALLFGVWIGFFSEAVLRLKPLASYRGKIAYLPSAFSTHRLADWDQDVAAPEGGGQYAIRGGYRAAPFDPAKPEGEFRVFVLGGSFVFDIHAGDGRDWPTLLQERLRAAGRTNVRVVNAGVPGHATFDSLGRLLGEVQFYQPDAVILCHAWNDIKYFRDISPEKTPLRSIRPLGEPLNAPPSGFMALLDSFQLFRRASKYLGELFGPQAGLEGSVPDGGAADAYSPHGPAYFRRNLEAFVDVCRNAGAEPMLLLQPRLVDQANSQAERALIRYEFQRLTHDALCRAFAECDEAAAAVAASKGAFLLDVGDAMNGDRALFRDHVHTTAEGSERLADIVAARLAEHWPANGEPPANRP